MDSGSSTTSNTTTSSRQDGDVETARSKPRTSEMSYKFQRLREKLRARDRVGRAGRQAAGRAGAGQAVSRQRQDAEQGADRPGRRGRARPQHRARDLRRREPPRPPRTATGRWLLLCDDEDPDALILLEHLRRANPDTQSTCEGPSMRPSVLNAFSAVVDAAAATPESFLRDLVVRNLTVVAVGREARMYSMHAVLVDAALGGARIARDLLLAGHRKLAAVESRGSSVLISSMRATAARLAPEASVDAFSPEDAGRLGESGVTAVVCDSAATAAPRSARRWRGPRKRAPAPRPPVRRAAAARRHGAGRGRRRLGGRPVQRVLRRRRQDRRAGGQPPPRAARRPPRDAVDGRGADGPGDDVGRRRRDSSRRRREPALRRARCPRLTPKFTAPGRSSFIDGARASDLRSDRADTARLGKGRDIVRVGTVRGGCRVAAFSLLGLALPSPRPRPVPRRHPSSTPAGTPSRTTPPAA